eukprot:scaffold8514_cov74-Skeletonema_dohrnii-CCMP3373.AAC.3
MGRGARKRNNKQKASRAVTRQSTFSLAQERPGKPTVVMNDDAYKTLEQQKKNELSAYIHQHQLHNSTNGLRVVRRENQRTVVVVSSSLQINPKLAKKITSISPSEKGLNLQQRSAAGLRIGPEESFEVRWDDIDGQLIAIMLRGVFSPREARAIDKFREKHKQQSQGWSRGCEADTISRLNTTRRQVKIGKIVVGSTGINKNNALVNIKPGGKGETTRLKMEYINQEGKPKEIPFNHWIDRCTWEQTRRLKKTINYSDFLRDSDDSVKSYFNNLQHIYMRESRLFMDPDDYDDNKQEIMDLIHLNSNIIDDDLSKMGVHRDPSTPTPALACGSTNYVYDEEKEEWMCNNYGGRLFIVDGLLCLDYRPMDVAVFDGNYLHGVSKMKPVKGKEPPNGGKYNRFSMILFSRYQRSQKIRKHGWNLRK